MNIKELKEAVKMLSPQERILLVQYVLGTLINEDLHLSDMWKKELEVRSESYEKGEVKISSWNEVKERLIP